MKSYYLVKTTILAIALLLSEHCAGQSDQKEKEQQLLGAFYQGEANNCASIALIKAAMHKYGYNKLFKYKLKDGNYDITLRNGQNLLITDQELLQAKKYSRFETGENKRTEYDSVIFYAYLAYACIAKYIEKHGYWDCEENDGRHIKFRGKFEDTLIFITRTSYCTDYCYKLLGLDATTKTANYFKGGSLSEKGTILYSWRHAVFAMNDQFDCYGEWQATTTRNSCGQKFEFYLVLK